MRDRFSDAVFTCHQFSRDVDGFISSCEAPLSNVDDLLVRQIESDAIPSELCTKYVARRPSEPSTRLEGFKQVDSSIFLVVTFLCTSVKHPTTYFARYLFRCGLKLLVSGKVTWFGKLLYSLDCLCSYCFSGETLNVSWLSVAMAIVLLLNFLCWWSGS